MMFLWWKWRSILISRKVRTQSMECSKGLIYLMATFILDALCTAEQTTPYPPSLTTSSIGYCFASISNGILRGPLRT